jgi:aminopeptidase N
MERSSGQTLDWFFEQWLRRPGYPELGVTWSLDPSSQQVTLDITQAARYGAYRFPLTVELRDAAGVARREKVVVPAETHVQLTLPLGATNFRAVGLTADPDVELLARIDAHAR